MAIVMVVSILSFLKPGKLAGVDERIMVHSLLFFVRFYASHTRRITFFFKHLTVATTAQIKARICKAMKITVTKGDEISQSARRKV